MFYIRRVLIAAGSIFCCVSFSQNDFETLGESSLAADHKVSKTYSVNFAARSRYFIYRNEGFEFKNKQIDLVHFSTLKLNYNRSLSVGIQYRFREAFGGSSNELRLSQQFNYTKQNLALRFGYRFRLEQRILEHVTIWRSRYRFALDFPLNGEKLDIGEGYLVTSMEALLSVAIENKPEFDHRTSAQIGWLISENLKLQTGLEYRFEAFNLETEYRLFVSTSVILQL